MIRGDLHSVVFCESAMVMTSIRTICCSAVSDVVAAKYTSLFSLWQASEIISVIYDTSIGIITHWPVLV